MADTAITVQLIQEMRDSAVTFGDMGFTALCNVALGYAFDWGVYPNSTEAARAWLLRVGVDLGRADARDQAIGICKKRIAENLVWIAEAAADA